MFSKSIASLLLLGLFILTLAQNISNTEPNLPFVISPAILPTQNGTTSSSGRQSQPADDSNNQTEITNDTVPSGALIQQQRGSESTTSSGLNNRLPLVDSSPSAASETLTSQEHPNQTLTKTEPYPTQSAGTSFDGNDAGLNPSKILIKQIYSVVLQAKTKITWEVNLGTVSDQEDLFLTAQFPQDDPLQQPDLSIRTAQTELYSCYAASSQFAGICRVDRRHIRSNLTVFVTAMCISRCHLRVSVDLQPSLSLPYDRPLLIKAPKNLAKEYELELQVPLDINFTQLGVFAEIKDFSEAAAGLELYANIGKKDAAYPSSDSYAVAGQSIFWGGEALYFSRSEFTQDSKWLKIYLSLSAGMEVQLFTRLVNGNIFQVDLSNAYFDFTTTNQSKKYYLDLSPHLDKITNKTISLGFVIYAGNPKITVGLDPEFKNQIKGSSSFGMQAYILTQSARKILMTSNFIYITVSSAGNSDYYFFTSIEQNNSLKVKTDVSYYSRLKLGEVFNYFFTDFISLSPDQSSHQKRTYTIKIDSTIGQGTYGVRRCYNAEKGANNSACLISSIKDLDQPQVNRQFKEIPVVYKETPQFFQMVFAYSPSQCHLLSEDSLGNKIYYCYFHSIVVNEKESFLEYTWTVNQRAYSSLLKEGQLVRDAVFKEGALYYRFGLSTLEGVSKVTFFLTLMEGDVYFISSTSDPYPSFSSKGTITSSRNNRIVYNKQELAKIFYIAVVGKQFSEYALGVVVSREVKTQELTPHQNSRLKLQIGVNQDFVLEEDDQEAVFLISSPQPTTVNIEVLELVGTISMEVRKQSGVPIKCIERVTSSVAIACQVTLDKAQDVEVVVKGVRGVHQRFVISYYKSNRCTPSSLNMPAYKQIPVGSSQCSAYFLTNLTGLQLVISIPLQQMFRGALILEICLNGKCKVQPPARSYFLSKLHLAVSCSHDDQDSRACPIQLNFTNNSTSSVYFDFILRQQSSDILLFDGIVEKVRSSNLERQTAHHFYFNVNSFATVRIFFTSYSPDPFRILCRFVPKEEFNAQNKKAYLTDESVREKEDGFLNFYVPSAGPKVFVIASDDVTASCRKCVLTFSILRGNDASQQLGFSQFDLEVSQQESTLQVGKSKVDYIGKGQIYVYELQQPNKDAVISVRDLSKQSSKNGKCFSVSYTKEGDISSSTVIPIEAKSLNLTIYIVGVNDNCNFQISYSSFSNPIMEIHQNQPLAYASKQGNRNYFLYTHHSSQAFRVIHVVSSGSTRISAVPITSSPLGQLITTPTQSFPFQSATNTAPMVLGPDSSLFCKDCTYLIAATSEQGGSGEIIVCPATDPIPLSIKGIIQDRINSKKSPERKYSFRSISSFNLILNIIYGALQVTIFNPDGKVVQQIKMDASSSTYVKVEPSTKTFEEQTYIMIVSSLQDASYTIKASKIDVTNRIFEGMLETVQLLANRTSIIEFSNFQTHSFKNSSVATLNVIMEVVEKREHTKEDPVLLIKVFLVDQYGTTQDLPIVTRTQSQSSINIELPLVQGDYLIQITSTQLVSLNVLLVKQSLVHLKPLARAVVQKETTFQLYALNRSIMVDIYPCGGDLSVEAAYDYASLGKPGNEIDLQSHNYGGHYVVSAQSTSGEYFLKVRGKKGNPFYSINYYYYGLKEAFPYKIFSFLSNSINYTLVQKSITFRLQPLSVSKLVQTPIRNYTISYLLYFSDKKDDLTRYSNCRLGSLPTRNAVIHGEQAATFTLESSDLTTLPQVYFVAAEAIADLDVDSQAGPEYPRQLSFVYEPIQIVNPRFSSGEYTLKDLLLLALVPFLVAGSALVLALKYCIKRYMGMVPDGLVEEQVGSAGESGEVANPNKEAETQKNVQSGQEMKHEDV